MDNIEKNIAQGYADFTDDNEVTAKIGGDTSFSFDDTLQFSSPYLSVTEQYPNP